MQLIRMSVWHTCQSDGEPAAVGEFAEGSRQECPIDEPKHDKEGNCHQDVVVPHHQDGQGDD